MIEKQVVLGISDVGGDRLHKRCVEDDDAGDTVGRGTRHMQFLTYATSVSRPARTHKEFVCALSISRDAPGRPWLVESSCATAILVDASSISRCAAAFGNVIDILRGVLAGQPPPGPQSRPAPTVEA
jgi:hypothetical protein